MTPHEWTPELDRVEEQVALTEIAVAHATKKGQMEDADREDPTAEPDDHPSALVQWAGGKSRLVPEILKRLPKTCRRYYEPFAGSAAVFWAYRPFATHATISDVNDALIDMYAAVQRHPSRVENALLEHEARHSESHYYNVRHQFNEASPRERGTSTRAAQFMYLNRAGYNGLWRVNSKGAYNVPWGKRKKISVPTSGAFAAAWQALRGVDLMKAHYAHAIRLAGAGDVVYCDPPYVGTFADYSADGFTDESHRELKAALFAAAHRGAHVLLSINDCPLSRELYDGRRVEGDVRAKIDRLSVKHMVGPTEKQRKVVPEMLVTIARR